MPETACSPPPIAHSIIRFDDGIYFTFRDAKGNQISVPLTPEQLGSYCGGLAIFLTRGQQEKLAEQLGKQGKTS